MRPERYPSGKITNLFSDSTAMFSAAKCTLVSSEDFVSLNVIHPESWPPPTAQSRLMARVFASIWDASTFRRRIFSWSLRTRSRIMRFLFAYEVCPETLDQLSPAGSCNFSIRRSPGVRGFKSRSTASATKSCGWFLTTRVASVNRIRSGKSEGNSIFAFGGCGLSGALAGFKTIRAKRASTLSRK